MTCLAERYLPSSLVTVSAKAQEGQRHTMQLRLTSRHTAQTEVCHWFSSPLGRNELVLEAINTG